ncbi:Inhibitor of Bruton tyrosine kinase [Acipenser ruthenus]|uniref:Inhibitor of Bruton tyrosine kinase n=1 Tax=Acipenser ruthenus TaxID=7906 RepID=A0A444U582_ACIRT|nr:Inhibitor of Bruton tyrosine kinase [Acipenser ruthenus]
MNVVVSPDCTPKCRSLQHALDVISALTKGKEGQVKAFLSTHCHNVATLKDSFGRTALHFAASLGKRGVLDWLLDVKGADVLVKDKESGWTAMHRSVFYGHIDCLVSLVKVVLCKFHSVFLSQKGQVYTCGHGQGGRLGHGDEQTYLVPRVVEGLISHHCSQVAAAKDHTVALTEDGYVYTFGLNTFHQLGIAPPPATSNVPKQVLSKSLKGRTVIGVAAGRFHTVLWTKEAVYTVGLNGGQLGLIGLAGYLLDPNGERCVTAPRQVSALHHKDISISMAAASNGATVCVTEKGDVYLLTDYQCKKLASKQLNLKKVLVTGGFLDHRVDPQNLREGGGEKVSILALDEAGRHSHLGLIGLAGYLLDPNGERCVTAPRQVSALHHKDISISMAAASNGATVCVTEKGDVYLLTDYQCKKLASKQLNLKKVLVTGGFLDHRVDPQNLREGGGEKVSILALDEAGRVFCWKSSSGSVKQCRWAYGRQVFMSDIALSKSGMMFITMEGEGFSGQWVADSKKIPEKRDDRMSLVNSAVTFCHTESSTTYERIRIDKLPFVHRAVGITTESNGRNFAVLQSDPKTSLYEIPSVSSSSFSKDFHSLLAETQETDNIHDVTLQVGNRIFPAHKYILSMRSDYFRKHFYPESDRVELPDILHLNEDAVGCDLFALEKVQPDMFEYLLQFIYTDNCDLLTHGYRPKICQVENKKDCQDTLISSLQKISFHEGLKGKSAYEVYQSHQVNGDGEKQKTKAKNVKKGKGASEEANPVKTLQGLAKKFGIASLAARLDGVKVENGKINVVHKKAGNRPKFNQKKSSYMCDVTLRSEDGKDFPCHKCVLCARLEYFRSMLGSCWIEASCCSALEMPINSEILQVILDYIYTDESPTIRESPHVEFLCNVLVVADQLLISRLKEMCEVAITEKLTLKNAAELLEFASMYYADQLKLSCLQFIVLNMAALLEARTLDVLSAEVLKELSAAYQRMIPAMQRRIITPYPDGPDLSCFEEGDGKSLLWSKTDADTEPVCRETLLKRAKIKAKKKPRRRSDSSGGYNLSDIIHSPTSTGLIKIGKTNSIESLQELLTSDSEGSYAGVGSPRELQSPVFMAGPSHDQSEVWYYHKQQATFLSAVLVWPICLLLILYTPAHTLRSTNDGLLVIPRPQLKTYGARSFSFQAPSLWHSLTCYSEC